ncbi:GFA family protein [Massilia sp. S19_KUP03_FR1]|uniref:GFA family protein n=1 Tax=Massilia sp. S19_KUP03_FR1 TaxID=3025503 RepID=UPI002FCDBC65
MMTTKDNLLHGSCLCGGIVFHAALPALGASHCYCTMCQKFHGAAAGSYVNVASSGYVVEQGADLIVDYASSGQARRGFCRTCGSSLYWRSPATPEVIALSLGALQPAWTGAVTRELYVESKPTWLPRR